MSDVFVDLSITRLYCGPDLCHFFSLSLSYAHFLALSPLPFVLASPLAVWWQTGSTMCSAKQKHGRKAFEFLKGCNNVSMSQMRRRRDGFGPAGETPLGCLTQTWVRGGVGIGNAGVWGRTRIWKSQVPLKGKLLVVCRVAAAATNPRKQTKEEEQGGQGSAMRGVRGFSLIFFLFWSSCFNL